MSRNLCFILSILVPSFFVVHGGVPSLKWLSDAKSPVTNVYLDFDNTIVVDGFSEVVRNAFCKTEDYPDCFCGELCNNTMGLVTALYSGIALDGTSFDPVAKLTESFGGNERITRIKGFIDRLRSRNALVK